ncbi:MAG: trimethylamine methyltransferase family protein [Chloroflexi bacterium]|nr:trimethylamine methyltransferase family protein [Chloroflexota bacterium]
MTQDTVAFPRLTMLSRQQCEVVHRASLEILRRTGVRVHHEGALVLLRETDAVITDGNLVHLPAGLVQWALRQAPSRIALCQRGSSQVVAPLEGQVVNFGPGSDCPNVLDPRSGQRRRFTTADVVDGLRVCDALPEISFVMSMGIPADMDAANVYRQQYALMLEHTTKPAVFVCDDRADCAAIAAMAAAAAGGMEQLRLHPTLLLYSEPTTPLQHSETATGKLLYMAEQRLPIVHSPAPMMGGTAPVTLAGGLALGNAEVLSSLVMHQLQRPGAPFVYGSGLHHMDMKTTISVYGAPEFQLARLAVAEMGRFYGLPTWGYAGHSDSYLMDEQAAADAAFSVLVALLAGHNLVHDVGYLEAGLTTSPEMIVFSDEVISQMRRFVTGFSLDAEALALEVIHQVGPGGNFLTAEHTLRHFRELWPPALWDRRRVDDWVAAGRPRLGDRLRKKTISLMESHRPEPLPDAVREEISYILKSGQ